MKPSKMLKDIMYARNINAPKLAELLGCSYQSVSSWIREAKYPRMGALVKIESLYREVKFEDKQNALTIDNTSAAHEVIGMLVQRHKMTFPQIKAICETILRMDK